MFKLTQKTSGDLQKVSEQIEVQSKITWTVIPTSWYGASWTAASGYGPPAYAQDAFGFVHFRGIFSPGSGAGVVFLAVPDSLAPGVNEGFANDDGFFRVQTNGQFVASSATSTVFLSGTNYTTF